jgi:hypothetical protein
MFRLKTLIIAAIAMLLTLSICNFSFAQYDRYGQTDEEAAMEEALDASESQYPGVEVYEPEEKGPAPSAITEGMGAGDFAMTLVKELGVQGYMPAAATTMDAFALFEKIGCIPPGGWDESVNITAEDLCAMLSMKDCQGSFEELLEKLKNRLTDIFWNMGIRPVGSRVYRVMSPTTVP